MSQQLGSDPEMEVRMRERRYEELRLLLLPGGIIDRLGPGCLERAKAELAEGLLAYRQRVEGEST